MATIPMNLEKMTRRRSTMQRKLAPKSASIEIDGPRARIYGIRTELNSLLGHAEVVAIPSATGQIALERCWVPFIKHKQDHLAIPAGLVSRAVSLLQQQGYEVVVKDLRDFTRERLQVDHEFVRARRDSENSLVRQIIKHPLGQIAVQDRQQALEVISVVHGIWPEAYILVPVATIEEMSRVQRSLASLLKMPIGLARGKEWDRHEAIRCVVCTLEAYSGYIREWNDVIVFPFGHQAALDKCIWQYASQHAYFHSRIYLLRDSGRLHEPREDWRMEALVGPDIISAPMAQPSQPDVHVYPCLGPSQATQEFASQLERKRQAFWANAIRNRWIANIASALAQGDCNALSRQGLFLDEYVAPGTNPSITVLVESVEHAQALLKLLRGWETKQLAEDCQPRREQERCVVATQRWAARHGLDSDIVLYAAGTVTALDFRDFPRSTGDDARANAQVLIDMLDDFDHRAQTDGRRRLQNYILRNWQVHKATSAS